MATDKQIEANRLNALKSTGPRTDAGKEIARANALKHGLSGAGVVLVQEEEDLIKAREAEWRSLLKPYSPFELHLTHQIAVETARVDRIQQAERDLRGRLAERAATCWDADQRLAAEKLGKSLARDPAVVAIQLAQTPQGCDWVLERWEPLERALVEQGVWTPAQKALALDLLGTAAELRDLPTKLDPFPGEDATATCLAVVQGTIAHLKEYRTRLQPLDDGERAAASAGNATTPDPSLKLLHRYEAACHRRKVLSLKQFDQERPVRVPVEAPCEPPRASRPARLASSPAPYRYEDRAFTLLQALTDQGRPDVDSPIPALVGPSPRPHERR